MHLKRYPAGATPMFPVALPAILLAALLFGPLTGCAPMALPAPIGPTATSGNAGVSVATAVTITITSPLPGDTIFSPADLTGSVSPSPASGGLLYRVYEGDALIGSGPLPVDAHAGAAAVFTSTAVFTATEGGPGRIEVVEPAQSGSAPQAGAAVAVRVLTAAQAQMPGTQDVTGTITLPPGLSLPANPMLQVDLQEVSATGTATTIGQTIIDKPGSAPTSFEVSYDPASINPRHRYVIAVTLLSNGKAVLNTTTPYPVITLGNPTQLQIVVPPAQ